MRIQPDEVREAHVYERWPYYDALTNPHTVLLWSILATLEQILGVLSQPPNTK